MAYSHVAHDCVLQNFTTLANAGTLAGHVIVEDRAIIGGLSAVHQFVRIGKQALVGGCSKVVQDVPPYTIADGHPARVYGLNLVGIERAGLLKKDKDALKKAFKVIFKSGLTLKNAILQIEREDLSSPALRDVLEFLKKSERGISR
jgi:UDP-N-acetylglucosamine acyltransferase